MNRDRALIEKPLTQLALFSLGLATLLTFGRVYSGNGYLGPAIGALVAGTASAWAARRMRFGTLASAAASLAAFALYLGWVVFPETTRVGLPTLRTFAALASESSTAWREASGSTPPVPAAKGFVAYAVFAGWWLAYISDTIAFRWRGALESLVPWMALFVVTSALAPPDGRILATLCVTLTSGLVLAAHRNEFGAPWIGREIRATKPQGALLMRSPSPSRKKAPISRALLEVGGALAAAILVTAAVPIASAEPVVHWRSGFREDASKFARRFTPDPLVDIRPRLAANPSGDLFTVSSSDASYWRLTSLEQFDGVAWHGDESYASMESGRIPGAPDAARVEIRQTYTMINFDPTWLPAAYAPLRVDGAGPLRIDPKTLAIAPENIRLAKEYAVVSAPPIVTRQLLAGIVDVSPPNHQTIEVPDGVPESVREIARQWGGGGRPYEKALRIQDHLRTFTYDETIQGHTGYDLSTFLSDRRGYCEQFATAMAVMARAVGIPARVAIGFAPGEHKDGTDEYLVRTNDAHAWPELWFGPLGWVAFEPTPGRNEATASNISGTYLPISPEHGRVDSRNEAASPAPSAAASQRPDPVPSGAATESPIGTGAGRENRIWPAAGPLFVAALLASALLAVICAKRVRRKWRLRSGPTRRRVLGAWSEFEAAMTDAGCRPRPYEGPLGFVKRATGEGRLGSDGATHAIALAVLVERALYAPGSSDLLDADRAEKISRDAVKSIRSRGVERFTRALSLRSFRPPREARPARTRNR